MWDRIAERVNSESVEINAFSGEKTAKNCRDKMNNLNKKYKTVKDKSKFTGEGSDEIKSFPEFTDLDKLWGTHDTVTNKYVVEAGSNDQPIDETSTEGSDHEQSGKAVADEDEDAFREYLKVQKEYTKRREEERAELFSYLKKSDEQTHQLMISAIRELGEVLKGGNSSKNP